MKVSNFWFISLCALLIIGFTTGWNMPLIIAVVANALLVILNVWRRFRKCHKNPDGDHK